MVGDMNLTPVRTSGRSAAWTTAVLASLCATLGAIVFVEFTGRLSLAPQVTAAAPPSPEVDWTYQPTAFEPPARQELDIIAARPLFSPSRRPFVADTAEEVVPAAAAPLPPLELIGVLLTDRQQTALIRPLNGGEPAWVREDDAMAGWRIEKIERHRVHLRAGERVEVVDLRSDTAVPADARPQRRKAREAEKREAQSTGNSPAAADEPSETESAAAADEIEEESPD